MTQVFDGKIGAQQWANTGKICLLLAALVLGGCATAPATKVAAAKPAAAIQTTSQATAKPAPKAEPGSPLKPFADIIKDAKVTPGYFPIWQKDDKAWLEIPVEKLDQPLFFSWNVTESIGQSGFYSGQMGRRHIVVLHRLGNLLQMVARNTSFRAEAASPVQHAVRESFTDSLLSSSVVVSLPHPERKSILVDANTLLMVDIPAYSTRLESVFHIPYGMDRTNSAFAGVHGDTTLSALTVSAHFSIPRLPAPPVLPPGAPVPPTVPQPPITPPDPRSFFIGFVYSFAALPEPMPVRLADDRIGHFVTTVSDYTRDDSVSPRLNFVNRWRLEKKDPDAALSDPKQAIVFWVDRNVPERYRQTIIDGAEDWNKAFERIGISHAIVAKMQPEDAGWNNSDAHHASIRWYLGVDAGSAVGPSHADPRTGEILDADIIIPDIFTRSARRLTNEVLARAPSAQPSAFAMDDAQCNYAAEAAEETGFALDLLEARGMLDLDGPEAEKLAQAYLKDVVIHEVGHTLGLRHNFHASTVRSPEQLRDPEYTRVHGISASVMDYVPFNLALEGETQGDLVMRSIGPYDYWAIEYAYKPIAPEHEKEELAAIAARAGEPELAFGTDEDARSGPAGYDPEINTFDLGNDPLAYYQKRFALIRELWQRSEKRPLKQGESYEILRRNLERGFNEIARAAPLAAKYIGGLHSTRDHAGTSRPLLSPVEPEQQKRALALLSKEIFAVDSFRFPPEFLNRLGYDSFDRPDDVNVDIAARVLRIQTSILDQIMADTVAARLLDAENRSTQAPLTLAQVYDSLQNAIWSELSTHTPINRQRRNLQREHLRRLLDEIVRPVPGVIADLRSLQRANAKALEQKINAALARSGKHSREELAHLQESRTALHDALAAVAQKVVS